MKRLLRRIPVFVVSLLIVVLLVYGFWPTRLPVDVVTVIRGSFDVTVDDDGETQIREKYKVSAPVTGKLARTELHAGDAVEQDVTVLARIEPTDPELLDARTQAESEARVHAAQAACDQADARLNHAKEQFELAGHEYDRAKSLIPSRAISQAEFDRAEHAFRIAAADVRSAEFAVKLADFELELAQAALIRTQDVPQSDDPPATLVITSPISGRVLRIFREDAGVVTPGVDLLEIGDPDDLEMRIDVLSTDAVGISPAARVLVEHWGGPFTLEGVVRVVEPSAFLKVSALGVEEKRVNVIADFTEPAKHRNKLGDGFRIEARIVVGRARDIIKIPAGALFRDGDDWKVFRVHEGRAKLTNVIIGQSNGLETEIVEGLAVDDQVILHPTDNIVSGVRVSPN